MKWIGEGARVFIRALVIRRCRRACMVGVGRLVLRNEGGTLVENRSGDKMGEDVEH